MGEIWPSGFPENVLNSLDSFFATGCMDIQRHIPCVQLRNVAVFPFCATRFNGWTTWVDMPAPLAKVRLCYTVANDDFTNRVFYRQREYGTVLEWSQNRLCRPFGKAPATVLPPLPVGDRYADPLTDKYQTWILPIGHGNGRARAGIWATHRGRLYLAPWVQSNESIIAEWDGVKTQWLDADMVDLDVWNPQFEACLKWYVKWQYQASFGADRAAEQSAMENHLNKLAELINDCIAVERTRTEEGAPDTYASTFAQLKSEQITIAPVVTTVAVIGQYGTGDDLEAPVAAEVAAWNPAAIFTCGGNNFVDASTVAGWDTAVGQFYQSYIYPYQGTYGVGAKENRFWPALSESEIGNADVFGEYFAALKGRRYYTTLVGDIQVFVLSSGVDEPDGNSSISTQANWLQAALAFSPARWKVIVLEANPMSPAGPDAALDWPYQQWGADMVIFRGPFYERSNVGGLNFIANGSGGEASGVLGAVRLDSTAPYPAPNQGMIGTPQEPHLTAATLQMQFINAAGAVVDTVTLSK